MMFMIMGPNSCPVIFNLIIQDTGQKSNALFQEEGPAGRKPAGPFFFYSPLARTGWMA
jgi:hypothetical protein